MKILVTGDSGFIASFLIPRLIDKSHEVIGIDLVPYDHKNFTHEQVIGNIADRDIVLKATRDIDCIIHLAAVHADEGPTKDDYYHTNVTGTKVLLDVARELNINKIFFFSTVGVYGKISPADETTTPAPNNDYGSSKLEAEEAIIQWCREDINRNTIIVRPTAVYGPRNSANIFLLIKQVSEHNFLMIGNGKNKKTVIYIKNVISIVMYLLDHFEKQFNIYNLIDYPIITTNDLVNTIAQINQKKISKVKIPLNIATVIITVFNGIMKLIGRNSLISKKRLKKFCADTEYYADKIRQVGYQQEILTIDGLRETIEWNKIHNWQKDNVGK